MATTAPQMQASLEAFHPAVRAWFGRRFPQGPTEAQAQGWPHIAEGCHTLIAAPTGSGKTLAGFLCAIDQLYRAAERGDDLNGTTRVVYTSPLKALAVDVHHNLETPLLEIAATAESLGLVPPEITVAVRSGDTSSSERQAMVRKPPNILVTTPESLYLYVTAERSRETLRGVRTVIVDEIHATARDKRGAHLALTLERLAHVCAEPPVRIGLSATVKPLDTVARLLTGTHPPSLLSDHPPDRGEDHAQASPERPACAVVDAGHLRTLDLSLELPEGELEAVCSAEQMADVYDKIGKRVTEHRTTLVFVNTRRMAERVAHNLGERLGDGQVAAHHGSLSKERRHRIESRLRAGDLKALVATASLELGIDVGPVELVCQIGSPRSIATFLQRVGRSNHHRGGTPTGVLYPLTRDELVECCALLAAVRAGRLDALHPPEAPLDVLAQQVVAEVAAGGAEGYGEDALYRLVCRAAPYEHLSHDDFEAVLDLASEGIQTGRGRRAAYLHRDRVNGRLRPRRGARLAALTSGGAIPDTADYRVVLEPDDTLLGTVNEDWAIESMAGDVFLLGTHTWRIRRVEPGTVRVSDAEGMAPTIPFWLGEAPARTAELSEEVSELRGAVAVALDEGGVDAARDLVRERAGVHADIAHQTASYLHAGRTALGVMPTQGDVVFERFFDDTGGSQLVVHAPFGGRINRALGLALRKRFCVTFDFELQAAANDDAVLLSLGPQHSFALDEVARFLHPETVAEHLAQAVLVSPMFTARWRWNLNRALAVLRMRGGKRNPFPIQRMEADDVMAAVFPSLAACQDNAPAGPIEIPDHVLVRQTLDDCLTEGMDLEALADLLTRLESGAVRAHFVEATEASPLAHEILTARPYTFLDDAPLEERRSQAVRLRRGLPVEPHELGRLDPAAVERVREEAAPDVRDPDELHDLLCSLIVFRPVREWEPWFDALAADGRVFLVPGHSWGEPLWAATESRALIDSGDHATETVRGHLDVTGPVTAEQLAHRTRLPVGTVRSGLGALEAEGFALRGRWEEGAGEQWCARRLLLRMHAYTKQQQRAEIRPVTQAQYEEFLGRWQHTARGTQLQGRAGLLEVVEQLQGWELPIGEWEAELGRRVEGYRPEWLDDLCLSGEVVWGRLSLRPGDDPENPPRRGRATPSRRTPVTFMLRDDVPFLLQAARRDAQPVEPVSGAAREILDALRSRGALFHSELRSVTGRLPTEIEEGLWDGVARGLVTADGFQAVRTLLFSRQRNGYRRRRPLGSRGRRGTWRDAAEGRWALFPTGEPPDDPDDLAESLAEQVLWRWGLAFRDVYLRERFTLPWRDVQWALRRLEARGQIRGGRFVTGVTGEQYALPEAAEALRRGRQGAQPSGEVATG